MYKIIAHFDRGPSTYTADSEAHASELMDQLHEAGIPCSVTDADGNAVDENDLTDRIDVRSAGNG